MRGIDVNYLTAQTKNAEQLLSSLPIPSYPLSQQQKL